MGKGSWGIVIAAVAAVSLTAVAVVRVRKGPAEDSSPRPQTPTKPSDSSCLADEKASRGAWMAPETKPADPPQTVGGVRGRVLLPLQERKKSSYAYAIYAFTADGKIEGP
ncbi:MAG TPA: hypothetical protein VKW04_03785, partial [Planctomycetota bacterium]|nr:hypothetical protein [Planctomycetota bacterium]